MPLGIGMSASSSVIDNVMVSGRLFVETWIALSEHLVLGDGSRPRRDEANRVVSSQPTEPCLDDFSDRAASLSTPVAGRCGLVHA